MRNTISDVKNLYIFWVRRWLRTLPLYYVFLLLNIYLSYIQFIPTTLDNYNWHFWLFLQNLYYSYQGFFWESWSLAVEEWFYLLYPLLFLLVLRFFSAKNSHGIVLFIFLMVPSSLRLFKYLYYPENSDGFFWDIEYRKVVLLRLDAIGFGILAAWINYFFPKLMA